MSEEIPVDKAFLLVFNYQNYLKDSKMKGYSIFIVIYVVLFLAIKFSLFVALSHSNY